MVKERNTKMTMSSIAPMKGASEEWTTRRVLGFIRELGLENSEIVIKTGQGNSIMDVRAEIIRRRIVVTHP